tara:strand:+ start:28325 stop:29725 length:1401 start_codon:yes stop_codon:yes gene_type:complete
MSDFTIDTRPTLDFHERLKEIALNDTDSLHRALLQSNDEMARFGDSGLDSKQILDAALTAFLLDQAGVRTLYQFATTLHNLVEKTLNYVIDSPELLRTHFPSHERIFPHLKKTAGTGNWQVISRCDLAITPGGGIKVMELNNGCPGGYIVSRHLIEPSKHALRRFGFGEEIAGWSSVTVEPNAIVDTLLKLETKAGIEPGVIGILYDENELKFELDELAREFEKSGRVAKVADARKLEYRDGKLFDGADYLSATYNKFRVSTPDSPNHCWKAGFEERYPAYLRAQDEGVVVTINNLCGMTIAEDKGLLALLRRPEFQELMSPEEQALVQHSVLWTERLEDREVEIDGAMTNVLEHVRTNKDRYVIKPANEGRGFGVVIGKSATQETWDEACKLNPELPCIVQEYVELISMPVGNVRSGKFAIDPMHLTLAVANADGTPHGLVCRISSELVTNVSQCGFGQAAFQLS